MTYSVMRLNETKTEAHTIREFRSETKAQEYLQKVSERFPRNSYVIRTFE